MRGFVYCLLINDRKNYFKKAHLAVNKSLLPDHCVVLVVGVVGITQLAVRSEFELEKLVTEFSFVTDIVTEIEVVAHFGTEAAKVI